MRVIKSGETTSDFYAHADSCPFVGYVDVAQGRHISYTGTTGVSRLDFPDHLHFMRTTTTSNSYSASFTMEGISNFQGTEGNTATSDNLAAGYSTPPVQWQQSIHDKYLATGGISIVGASVALPYYQSPCLTSSSGWRSCTAGGYSGTVQTFRGAGSVYGGSEHGIFQRSGGNAVFMSRALYYPYTLYWDGSGHQRMYFIGYPLADSYYWYGVYRMDFQNGYATFNPSGCQSLWYQGSTLIKSYSGYCD